MAGSQNDRIALEAYKMAQTALAELSAHAKLDDDRFGDIVTRLENGGRERDAMRRQIVGYLQAVIVGLFAVCGTLIVTYVLPHGH